MAERIDCDVLIAGGGPTGVTLAVLLAQRGVRVVVAEKEADIYPLPRAAHLDHEAIRILQEVGVAGEVMATSRRSPRYDFLTAAGEILLRFEGSDRIGSGGWPAANMIHQPSVEAALRRRLAGLPGAQLHSRWEMTGWSDDGAGVTATLSTPDGPQEIRAAWLVGADGARSPVRHAAGIAFDDLGFEEPWLVVDTIVHDAARLPDANLQICDPARPTTCVLMGEGRHRWEFMILPGESAEEVASDASVGQLLKPWNVEGAVTLERKAVYTFRARIAQQWRKGRVLLAGDAAHQTPPFAGQGMCSGLRDAANLGWKLAAIVNDGAGMDLLSTYQTERAPNLRATIDMAVMMGRTVCITDPQAAAARDAQMLAARAAGHSPDGTVEYPPIGDGLILTGSPGAGAYFPQPVADEARLDDVLGAGYWLIDRAALERAELAAFREALAGWLDTHQAEAVLVRPDRYVFGTGRADDLADAWAAALRA
jgi:3-(3-hydroxy-phenyl)propionate hydroxylase